MIWLDDATRQVVAGAIEHVVSRERYTCYACAVLRNHAHLLIRRHRDTYQVMFERVATAVGDALRSFAPLNLEAGHPVISQRPYATYGHCPDDVWRCIKYINANPTKESLSAQRHGFVRPYDNWPQRKSVPR